MTAKLFKIGVAHQRELEVCFDKFHQKIKVINKNTLDMLDSDLLVQ